MNVCVFIESWHAGSSLYSPCQGGGERRLTVHQHSHIHEFQASENPCLKKLGDDTSGTTSEAVLGPSHKCVCIQYRYMHPHIWICTHMHTHTYKKYQKQISLVSERDDAELSQGLRLSLGPRLKIKSLWGAGTMRQRKVIQQSREVKKQPLRVYDCLGKNHCPIQPLQGPCS